MIPRLTIKRLGQSTMCLRCDGVGVLEVELSAVGPCYDGPPTEVVHCDDCNAHGAVWVDDLECEWCSATPLYLVTDERCAHTTEHYTCSAHLYDELPEPVAEWLGIAESTDEQMATSLTEARR
jgi:hypothetical protein